jgi:hypothetical protein
MLSNESKRIASESKKRYEQLREKLESSDLGKFICIEPKSGEYFIGDTFDDAVNKAIDKHPDRLTHTLRIGHFAALHLGVLLR